MNRLFLLPCAIVLAGLPLLNEASAAFVLVDDFESYTANTNTTDPIVTFGSQLAPGSAWSISGDGGDVNVVSGSGKPFTAASLFGTSNKVLRVGYNSGTNVILSNSSLNIPDGGIGTLFFRFAKQGNNGGIGRIGTDDATGTFYTAGIQVDSNTTQRVRGRNAGTDSALFTGVANAVYNYWLVFNNDADDTDGNEGTYNVYVQSDGDANYATQTLLTPTAFAFADGNIDGALERIFILATADSLFLDDLYVDNSAANLTNPLLVPEPSSLALIGMGALLIARRRRFGSAA